MTFLAPITAILAAALAIPALVLMYFLKLRRQQVAVPTTLLWMKSIQDMQASSPFQKLRRNLLLLLQLLLLIALLAALARPMVEGWSATGRRVVIVIDHSASMNARDVSPSRLAHARSLARQLVADAAVGQGVMIVSLAHESRIVEPFTADRDRLRRAIDAIAPSDEAGRLQPAITLLEQFARQEAGLDVYLLSDGRFADAHGLALEGHATLRLLKVHGDVPMANQGIVTLAARRDPLQPRRVEVFVGLSNDAPEPVPLTLTVRIDGRLDRLLPVTANGTLAASMSEAPSLPVTAASFALDDQAGHFIVEVALEGHDDALAVDNRAWVLVMPRGNPSAVVVGQRPNALLMRALQSAGVAQVEHWQPQAYESAGQSPDAWRGHDLIVFDGYEPRVAPARPSLSLGAGLPTQGLRRVEEADDRARRILSWRRDHAVLRYAGLDDLAIADPARLELPAEAGMLAATQTGPAIAMIDRAAGRRLVVAFDPTRSNWPLQVGFPVFMSNAVQWLCAERMAQEGWLARPGQAVTVPLANQGRAAIGDKVTYQGPATLEGLIQPAGLTLAPPDRVGVYRAAGSVVAPPWDRLPVSLLDLTESDLRPAADLMLAGQPVATVQPQEVKVRQPAHRWFLLAALALLLGEWLLYVRRNRL